MGSPLLLLLCLLCFAAVITAEPGSYALPDCPSRCGDVEIPYPFGIGTGCHLPGLGLTCNNSFNPPKPIVNEDLPVSEIMLGDGVLRVEVKIARDCYDKDGNRTADNRTTVQLPSPPYALSTQRNKFMSTGCDTVAWFQDLETETWTGCATSCTDPKYVQNGTCSGVGCCETSIPKGINHYQAYARSDYYHKNCFSFNPCSYTFVAEINSLQFSVSNLSNMHPPERVPVILDWVIENKTCEQAKMTSTSFACIADKSVCVNSNNINGYWCNCSVGYQGNPYIKDGCTDIDECAAPDNPCVKCVNTPGSYYCTCPSGKKGDGRKDGSGCSSSSALAVILGGTVSASFLLLAIPFLYWIYRIKKRVDQKKACYERNGGKRLESKISLVQGGSRSDMRFTIDELEKATNTRIESLMKGGGRENFEAYDGKLNEKTFTIEKYKKLEQDDDVEHFISEIVHLHGTKHKNVAKLYGCCLETEYPLLVYEQVSDQKETLYHKIHDQRGSLSFDARLKIAAETAGGLAYLHSDSSTTHIVHGDIRSENILLVSDGTSKVIRFAFSILARDNVQDTTSAVYLDPECSLENNTITDKSDVYSFGVVLAELLTGNEPTNENIKRFIYCTSNQLSDILEDRCMSDGSTKQLEAMWKLAKRCLEQKRNMRPTMKEVAAELEALRINKP